MCTGATEPHRSYGVCHAPKNDFQSPGCSATRRVRSSMHIPSDALTARRDLLKSPRFGTHSLSAVMVCMWTCEWKNRSDIEGAPWFARFSSSTVFHCHSRFRGEASSTKQIRSTRPKSSTVTSNVLSFQVCVSSSDFRTLVNRDTDSQKDSSLILLEPSRRVSRSRPALFSHHTQTLNRTQLATAAVAASCSPTASVKLRTRIAHQSQKHA